MFGLVLLLILLLFSVLGRFLVDVSNADPLSVSPEKPPSWVYPFGTDSQGRDLLAVMVAGTPLTLRIGVIAGVIGLGVGTTLAFVSAFYGGAVGAIASAILASIGLEALGLGPIDSPTLGMTIYWVIYYAALLHGYWWWWLPPIAIITILFVGLFNLAGGLDEIANPRLRKTV